jgi:hypothetical protein
MKSVNIVSIDHILLVCFMIFCNDKLYEMVLCLVFSTANSYLHLTGNTLVTDRYVRLTSDSQSKAGGLWNTIPVSYPDWEMHVHFKVHGTGKELFGDGFAIWYVRDPKLGGKYQDSFIAFFEIKFCFL